MVLSGATILLAGCLVVAPSSFAVEAREPGPPDSARLAKLESTLAGGAAARVFTAGGWSLLRRVRVSSEGIAGEVADPAHDAITSFEPERRLVSWSEIERVERRESWAGRGARIGLAVGFVAGIALAASIDEPFGGQPAVGFLGQVYPRPSNTVPIMERVLVIVATPGLGAVTGGLIGSFVPRWRVVVP